MNTTSKPRLTIASTVSGSHPLDWDESGRPYSLRFGDHYYSSSGGLEECRHVFINGNHLQQRWQSTVFESGAEFTIAELGFGSGLNFLETWRQWKEARAAGQRLNYVAFELLPMGADDMRRAISAWPELKNSGEAMLDCMGRGYDGLPIRLDSQTSLTIIPGNCCLTLPQWFGVADAWYLDGFSPAKNPDMWSTETMEQVFQHCAPDGTFSTYTSAGWVRENLQKAGFIVQRQPGFGQKKHMSTGFRPN